MAEACVLSGGGSCTVGGQGGSILYDGGSFLDGGGSWQPGINPSYLSPYFQCLKETFFYKESVLSQ